MRPAEHLAASLLLAPAAWFFTGDLKGACVAAFVQIFLDIDHLVEHLFKGGRPFTLKEFTAPLNSLNWTEMHFLLHSHEIAVTFAIIAWFAHLPILGWIAAGYAVHLFLDEIGNRRSTFPIALSPGFYLLFWRLACGFKTSSITCFRTVALSQKPEYSDLKSGIPKNNI